MPHFNCPLSGTSRLSKGQLRKFKEDYVHTHVANAMKSGFENRKNEVWLEAYVDYQCAILYSKLYAEGHEHFKRSLEHCLKFCFEKMNEEEKREAEKVENNIETSTISFELI